MQLSPLILKGYIVTNFSVKAEVPKSAEEAAKALSSGMSNLSTKVEVAKSQENQRVWKVALKIALHPCNTAEYYPYKIDVELLGMFEVANGIDESRIQDFVAANGPAVLYGAARELVLLVTGRGPMPPVTLPSATFVDLQASKKVNKAGKPD